MRSTDDKIMVVRIDGLLDIIPKIKKVFDAILNRYNEDQFDEARSDMAFLLSLYQKSKKSGMLSFGELEVHDFMDAINRASALESWFYELRYDVKRNVKKESRKALILATLFLTFSYIALASVTALFVSTALPTLAIFTMMVGALTIIALGGAVGSCMLLYRSMKNLETIKHEFKKHDALIKEIKACTQSCLAQTRDDTKMRYVNLGPPLYDQSAVLASRAVVPPEVVDERQASESVSTTSPPGSDRPVDPGARSHRESTATLEEAPAAESSRGPRPSRV